MTSSPQNAPSTVETPGERGFVLVGVVIMVLALTILVASLFSLSTYEAQFLGGSQDREQAFNYASGGIDRAKYLLSTTGRLESVASSLPFEGITDAAAFQYQAPDTVSTGQVVWGGDDVRIRVTAKSGEQVRTLEGRYRPNLGLSYYKRLITSRDSLEVGVFDNPDTTRRDQTVRLDGEVWENNASDSVSWQAHTSQPPSSPVRSGGIPVPETDAFLSDHAGAVAPSYDPVSNTYTFAGNPDSATYFRSNLGPAPWSLFNQVINPGPTLKVTGKCVWLLDHGARFKADVNVLDGGQGACLEIVAGPNGLDTFEPTAGIWFVAGLGSPVVPVILVTKGSVIIEYFDNPDNTRPDFMRYLSVYAGNVKLWGPHDVTGHVYVMSHSRAASEDSPGGIIDVLSAQGALPNASGFANPMALVPGTWHEITP
jgi:hypothetical protein